MNQADLSWVPCGSKGELMQALANEAISAELVTEDPNFWGFFKINGQALVVGYANIGLCPLAIIENGRLLVGINEILAGFDVNALQLQLKFCYRMPSVFHEFISLSNPIIVRDEIGFVGIAPDGIERWKYLLDGPIDKFSIEKGWIHGRTLDESFEFQIPGT